jgi:hypothetical protein
VLTVQVGEHDRIKGWQFSYGPRRLGEAAAPQAPAEVGPLALAQEVGTVRTAKEPIRKTVVAVPMKVSVSNWARSPVEDMSTHYPEPGGPTPATGRR